MATLDHISGAEPSTVTFKLRTASFTQNSSKMHSEVMVLGDPDSTNALGAVLNTAPASTAWGLVVRQVGTLPTSGDSTVVQGTSPWVVAGASTVAQASTVWAVQMSQYSTTANVSSLAGAVIVRSSAANALVSVYQSTASELQATVTPVAGSTWRTQPGSTLWASSAGFHFDGSGNLNVAGTFSASTTVSVSQLLDSSGGSVTAADSANNAIRVNVVAGAAGGSTIVTVSTGSVRVHQSTAADHLTTVYQSTAADLNATVTQAGTWTVNIGTHIQSSVAPSSNSSGIIVRQVVSGINTTASTNAFASTSLTIASSVASRRAYVTAYSITTTNAGPTQVGFYSSNTLLWPIVLAAVSSAVSGVNLAVTAPSYLFKTTVSEALSLRTNQSAVAGWVVGVSYYQAP